MFSPSPCPVCASTFAIYLHDVYGCRSGNHIPQYYCMDCSSFWNFSGYRETAAQQLEDCNYVIERQDHIAQLQARLLLEIIDRAPGIKSCCEIGYGTGLFLKNCTYFGIEEYGFEVNPYAAKYAREVVGVRCEEGLFSDKHEGRYDLMAAIGVFEHLENPRGLFQEMVRHLNPDGYIYLSVPFVERRHWRYLKENLPGRNAVAPPNPFYDNDVHIMHFSIEGLTRMGMQFGATSAQYFLSEDTVKQSPGAYPGILFAF